MAIFSGELCLTGEDCGRLEQVGICCSVSGTTKCVLIILEVRRALNIWFIFIITHVVSDGHVTYCGLAPCLASFFLITSFWPFSFFIEYLSGLLKLEGISHH
jgi:hypothetical protein